MEEKMCEREGSATKAKTGRARERMPRSSKRSGNADIYTYRREPFAGSLGRCHSGVHGVEPKGLRLITVGHVLGRSKLTL
jgi:hypothetical protein